MSRVRFRSRPGTVRLAALSALLVCCVASAQPPSAPPETTVYLVLRTGPKETEEGILETLKLGIEKSGAKIGGEPTIKSVSPAFLEEFEALVDRASTTPAVVAAKEGPSIRLLPSREVVYELRIPATQVLKRLRVTYEKAGEKEYLPAAPGQKSPLVLTVPGRYAFTPEANDVPKTFLADVSELGKSDTPLRGEWPKADKCFIVTLRNFQGDRKRLFDTIQDGKLVANPLRNVKLGNDLVFAFASLNSEAAKRKQPKINQNNELIVTLETLPERNPKRVWFYFPLDEKQVTAARDKFRRVGEKALPEEIRKSKPVRIDQLAKLGPADEPRWFELTDPSPTADVPPREFERKIKLSGLPDLARKYPRLWGLVVYEFDVGKPQVIKVEDPAGEPTIVLEHELDGWQKEIQGAVQRQPKP
jgi:hypothetical protein